MEQKIVETIEQINISVRDLLWLDMSLYKLERNVLTVVGSSDLVYGHSHEIALIDVFHISSNTEWRTTPSKGIIKLAEPPLAYMFNKQYRIEAGNFLFHFINDDNLNIILVAKEIEFRIKNISYVK